MRYAFLTAASAALVATATVSGATFGTLLIDDPGGDATLPVDNYDLRELWMDSDGTDLEVTMTAEDLDDGPTAPLVHYTVSFHSSVSIPGEPVEITCWAGTVGESPPQDADCTLKITRESDDCPPGVDCVDVQEIDVDDQLDADADRWQITVPYDAIDASSGEELTDIELQSWACHRRGAIAGLPGGWSCVGMDSGLAEEPYTLA